MKSSFHNRMPRFELGASGLKSPSLASWLLAAALVLLTASAPAPAQTYPSKPIHIIVPFGAGTFSDLAIRMLGDKLRESWGQAVVVENRVGAGGGIGMQYVAKAAPDGYTLVMGSIGTHVINASIYTTLLYDPVKEFVPVAFIADAEGLLVVHPSVPANSVAELIALARKAPGTLFFGSAGAGTTTHLAGELFKSLANVNLVHVPYKTNVAAATDVVSGQITMMFAQIGAVLPFVKDNRLKPIATMGAERSALLPQIPTLSESGLAGYEVPIWLAIFAPAGTPAPIVGRLNAEINRILRLPEIKARMQRDGLRFYEMTPEQLGKFVQSENIKWTPIVKASGAKVD